MITTGIMSGMEGVLLRRQNGARIVICLDSIFRAFVVEVDEGSVQPLADRGHFFRGRFRIVSLHDRKLT